MDDMERLITDLNVRLNRLERIGYIIVGLMAGAGALDLSKFLGTVAW